MRNKFHDWVKAREEGIIPQDMLEKYDNGEKIKHKTAYGDSYFWKESHERSIEFETDLEKSIEVNPNFLLKLICIALLCLVLLCFVWFGFVWLCFFFIVSCVTLLCFF